jgi:5-methyltetrahydrofolate corrinoid/iron sulfur protein methyltransferase
MIVISERVNGLFKKVGKAIDTRDSGFLRDLAREQVAAGAHILDINTGPGVDNAPEVMAWMVETVQSAVEVQLSIDTPDPVTMRSGLKACKRPALMNSTTAEEKKMEVLFPLAREFGADIICLTLTEKGIPNDENARCELAMLMLTKAMEYEITPDRIYLDPLVMPVGAAQDQGPKVLEALKMFKSLCDPAPKTTCGLSNVSNSTKERPLFNRIYLSMLMAYGLDSAICDPTDPELMKTVKAAEVLLNKKLYCTDFLKVC